MNRRELLLLGPALAGSTILRAAGPKPIPLAFSLYGMKSLPLHEAIATCAKLKYDGVELALMPGWHGDPVTLDRAQRTSLRDQLRDARLSLFALMENCPLDVDDKRHAQQLDRLKAAGELGKFLSPDAPPIIETILGGKPDQWEKVRDQFAARLTDWVKLAESEKLTLCLKAHRFGAVNRPEHVRWLLERARSERVKVAYDWSHFEQRDLKLGDTLDLLLPHTRFVHVKDTVMEKGQARFVLPGKGTTNYIELLQELSRREYAGCVCIEVSGMVSAAKGFDPIAAARESYDVLHRAYEKANVARR